MPGGWRKLTAYQNKKLCCLRERTRGYDPDSSHFYPTDREDTPFRGEETALWSSNRKKRKRQGSLTVEAAWAVPLFFLCMVTLICLMDMYGKAAEQQVRLQESAEAAGLAAGVAETAPAEVIDLAIPVLYRPLGLFGNLGTVPVAVRARVRPWIGRDPSWDTGEAEAAEERLVYVTENESVYHTDSCCTHLSLSVQAVAGSSAGNMRNEYGSRYHACDKCVGKGHRNGIVYITAEGDCYHNSSECGGLTRKVRMVPYSEADHLRECSRCLAREGADDDGGS